MMVGEKESAQVRIHRYAQTCELIFGQPISYYRQQIEKQFVPELDFSRYYMMITGLPRQVYRPFFGIDAFLYSKHFEQIEIEIVQKLETVGVRCMTTMLLYDHTKRFCMIFNKPESMLESEVAHMAADCFNRLYAQLFEMDRTPYCNYTVLSDEIHGYENLQSTFREMDALSRQQFFDMRTMIMTPALLEESRIPVSREQIHEDITLLRTAVRERDMQSTRQTLGALFDRIGSARDFDLLGSALHAIRALTEGMLASQGREMDDLDAFSMEHYPTMNHLRAGVEEKLLAIISGLSGAPAMSTPVLEAVRYIRHHFAEDVSLADVARHIDMSPSWLTKHFNQECRMSVPAYLLEVRMEHAKTMLAQTNMLVFEVSSAVGFENPRYFGSVFKKATGMTPKAYREYAKKT